MGPRGGESSHIKTTPSMWTRHVRTDVAKWGPNLDSGVSVNLHVPRHIVPRRVLYFRRPSVYCSPHVAADCAVEPITLFPSRWSTFVLWGGYDWCLGRLLSKLLQSALHVYRGTTRDIITATSHSISCLWDPADTIVLNRLRICMWMYAILNSVLHIDGAILRRAKKLGILQ